MPVRILVVEDNQETLRLYARALKRRLIPRGQDAGPAAGDSRDAVRVEEADTAAAAIEALNARPFDLVVVDLRVPGTSDQTMGGLTVIDACLELDPLRPVIVVTGFGTVELAKRTLTRGAFDFIEKSDRAVDDLVAAAQKALDTQGEKILRSGNPFVPMSGYEPTVFGGRQQELEYLEERLNRALNTRFLEHFLVLGDWGIGKSTLLREFRKVCQSRGHFACYVPLEPVPAGTDLDRAAQWIVGGIIRSLPYTTNRFERVAEFLKSMGFTITSPLGELQISPEGTKKDVSPLALLHDTLTRLWQDVEGKAGALVVLLDDLDNLMPAPEILMTLKQTLSMDSLARCKVLVGMASAKTNWLQLTTAAQHHPLTRFFISRVELRPLSAAEMRDTILKSLAGSGISFTPEVIDRVYWHTGGHPFEMQVLCHHLCDHQFSRRVDTEVWDKALQAALNDMGAAVFERWFSQASKDERKVLLWVAQHDASVSAADIRAGAPAMGVSPASTAKFLQRLTEKGLLTRTDRGSYAIADRMFSAYVRMQPPEWN